MVPGKKWYGLALLIFLAGPLLGLYIVINSIYIASKHAMTFFVPGASSLYIIHPGTYTLWTENLHPNASTQVINDFQNMSITFADPKTGKAVLLRPKVGWSSTDKGEQHLSWGTVKFDHAGTYQMIAKSPQYTPYKVYLRQPSLNTIIRGLVFGALAALIGIVTGILLAIIILIKRMVGQKAMTNTPNEQHAPSQEPKPKQLENISNHATSWAMACHLSGFAGFVFPFANIIAPLLVWAFKRQEYPYVDTQGKEAINFQLSITIYYIIAIFLILLVVGLFLLPLIAAFHIIAMIIAAVEAAQGRVFKYPLTIRFLK